MEARAVIRLYRAFLTTAKNFQDYNFRDYAVRRVQQGFRENQHVSKEQSLAAYETGRLQLENLKRQVTISCLYPEKASVLSKI